MRLNLALAALAAALLSTAATAGEPPTADDPAARYQALLAQAKADPAQADWTALRYAYAATPKFNVYAHTGLKHDMFGALNAGDYAGALKNAQAILDDDFVDIDAHDVAATAELKLGRAGNAALDRDIARRLAASVETGDGLSPASAYNVITEQEEFSILRLANLKMLDLQTGHAGPHHYDVVTATDANGRKRDYFFLIDAVWAAEAAASPDAAPQPWQARGAR